MDHDREPDAEEAAASPRCYLLVFDGTHSSVTQVVVQDTVVIGGAGADIPVGPAGGAPWARVRLEGDALCLEAASAGERASGARLNGHPITGSAPLANGDVIAVEGATLVVHREAPPPARRSTVALSQVLARLEEETERSQRYGRPTALLIIDTGPTEAADRERVDAAVADALRLMDVAGRASASEVLVLLPDTGDAARVPAERLVRTLAAVAPSTRAGLALCPADGCDPDTLLRAARDAVRVAAPGTLAVIGDTATTLTLPGSAIVVVEPSMKRLFSTIERLAATSLPVLVCGETGVGKEVVAAALHAWSPRRAARSVALNCAAVPDELLESQLFGHERGAFTGAVSGKAGLFEMADGGTLFLDEVGELSVAAQAKLLRVLETKSITRVGAVSDRVLDVRIVAATNRNLEAEVARGRFRQDLYFRLCAATVFVPPLRDRKLELPVLARELLARACAASGREPVVISPPAMQRLLRHRWQGNVRELKNAMGYVAATCPSTVLEADQLPEHLMATPWASGASPSLAASVSAAPSRASEAPPPSSGTAEARGLAQASLRPPDVVTLRRKSGEMRNIYQEIQELERTRMVEALEATGGVRVRAAELIGMPLRTFVTKLKEYGIGQASPRSRPPR